jgi:nucleotide-binding universal stress UspA family protein
MKTKESIVWAIDPLSARGLPVAKSRHMLSALTRGNRLKIDPVSILSAKDLQWPAGELSGRWGDKFTEFAQKSLRPVFRRARMKEIGEPTILQTAYSRADAVRGLIDYAREHHAKVIMVNMRSRKGWGRFRIGAFTESLLAASPIPVLAIRPDTRVPSRVSTIVLPTELVPSAYKVFRELLTLAKEWKAKVIIVHRLEVPQIFATDWVGFAAASEIELMREVMRENEYLKSREGQRWESEAKSFGVDAEFRLLRGMAPLAQSIVKAAGDSRADIVAVTAQDHTVTQTILGTAAKEVLRLSPRPVLVLQGRDLRALRQ